MVRVKGEKALRLEMSRYRKIPRACRLAFADFERHLPILLTYEYQLSMMFNVVLKKSDRRPVAREQRRTPIGPGRLHACQYERSLGSRQEDTVDFLLVGPPQPRLLEPW